MKHNVFVQVKKPIKVLDRIDTIKQQLIETQRLLTKLYEVRSAENEAISSLHNELAVMKQTIQHVSVRGSHE